MQSAHISRPAGRSVFGFPLEGFGLFSCLLLSFASALMTFCITTMIAIFSLLAWNYAGHHSVDFADTYLYVGAPASLLVLAIALPYFLTLWVRAKLHK
ncbi:MAG: hypothetical protein ACLGSD_16445 [Acidobacteriota bacterium]